MKRSREYDSDEDITSSDSEIIDESQKKISKHEDTPWKISASMFSALYKHVCSFLFESFYQNYEVLNEIEEHNGCDEEDENIISFEITDAESSNSQLWSVGKRVKVQMESGIQCGIIKWVNEHEAVAVVEFDKPVGTSNVLHCKQGHGAVIPFKQLNISHNYNFHYQNDSHELEEVQTEYGDNNRVSENEIGADIRYQEIENVTEDKVQENGADSIDEENGLGNDTLETVSALPKIITPITTTDRFYTLCGEPKGIQGYRNSCYMDATNFSLFAFSNVCDNVLIKPHDADDIQIILREEIVNPLRYDGYVKAGNVMKLRKLLDQYSSVKGLLGEEKDPEEYITALFQDTLKAEPFIKLSTGQTSFYYQVFVYEIPEVQFVSSQMLLQQSLEKENILFKEVPKLLILQMPRQEKVFRRIFPILNLDITNMIEPCHRNCTRCGNSALFQYIIDENIALCNDCFQLIDQGQRKRDLWRRLNVPQDSQDKSSNGIILLHLLAVICITGNHYSTYAKFGQGEAARWCYFNSMNEWIPFTEKFVPRVTECPGMEFWLTDESINKLSEKESSLPKTLEHVITQGFIFIYQPPEFLM